MNYFNYQSVVYNWRLLHKKLNFYEIVRTTFLAALRLEPMQYRGSCLDGIFFICTIWNFTHVLDQYAIDLSSSLSHLWNFYSKTEKTNLKSVKKYFNFMKLQREDTLKTLLAINELCVEFIAVHPIELQE